MYIVFIQDEYNNNWLIGVYKELKEAIPNVNKFFALYNMQIDELEEYASTYGSCFDKEIETPDNEYIMIRGFYIEGLTYNEPKV